MEESLRRKDSKLRHKIISLWRRIVRSDVRSRYSRLNSQPEPEDSTSGDSNCLPRCNFPLRGAGTAMSSESMATLSFERDPKFDGGRSGGMSRLNLFGDPKPCRNAGRRLSCHLSFTGVSKQEKAKGKIKELVENNRSYCVSTNDIRQRPKDVPKGFLAVSVGDVAEEQTRFVIPVWYLNHPLFLHLLQEAEQEYGFHQKGVFAIPCKVADFEYLQMLIERERKIKP